MTPEEIVQHQLEYYNAHRLDKFCATYSDDIQMFNLSTGERMLSGQAELREKYAMRFTVQKAQATLRNRMVIANMVIDHEEISGIKENESVKAVAIYEVTDGLISKVHFIFE